MKISKKKCEDCGESITIVGEHPPLEWCNKCSEYKNKDQWEKEYSESWPKVFVPQLDKKKEEVIK